MAIEKTVQFRIDKGEITVESFNEFHADSVADCEQFIEKFGPIWADMVQGITEMGSIIFNNNCDEIIVAAILNHVAAFAADDKIIIAYEPDGDLMLLPDYEIKGFQSSKEYIIQFGNTQLQLICSEKYNVTLLAITNLEYITYGPVYYVRMRDLHKLL